MAKRQTIIQENGSKRRREEGKDDPMRGLDVAEDLTTETVLETYDVKTSGGNCVHECVRPAEAAGQPTAALPSTPAKTYSFQLDAFQQEAVNCLERRESVMVAAHTSAGKTVVAEYAIAMALRDKQRIIYTSPIKALSNQKYRDLQDEFNDVGLMTGDVTINPHASCMIMTTEILRSMLYRGSDVSREMAWVVFDEVHYMRDRDRGVVWEEVMILLPDSVRLVFLSATIPNAREFAEWICRIKHQPCHVIYTDKRPVPLQHYLFPAGGDGVYMVVDEKGHFREDNFHKALTALQSAADSTNVDTKKIQKKKSKSNLGDLEKIVRMCGDRGYLPVIVFSFSRKECEANAVALKKMDVTDDDEKRLIDEVFNNAIMTLGDEDRELPQVQSMLPLLRRGLGIHHGGLLPMLKEVVEILFQESLIKVLFSTETFAMGINMPAKTVVFTNTRKWDGVEYRILNAGEYIQMSGRAGRRGKDDRGLTIIMFDEKVEPEVAKEMFLGQSSKIFSAFHLGYNMLINLLRLEGADPDYMIQRSFHQFQKDKSALEIQARKQDLETEVANLEDLRVAVNDNNSSYAFNVDEAIADYYYIDKQLKKKMDEKREIIVRPEHIAPFLNPGRLVCLKDGETDWGWGILISAARKKLTEQHVVLEDSEPQWVLDIFLPCDAELKDRPPRPDGKAEGRILSMALPLVQKISKIRSNMPSGDPDSEDSRRALLKTLHQIKNHKSFKQGIPELDPVAEMNIKTEEMSNVMSSIADLEKKLATNSFHGHEKMQLYYDCFAKKVKMHGEVQDLEKQINQSRFMVMSDDLRAMRRVLRRLEFIDKDGVVQLKGRMACEITSCDEILMTEIVFQNVFADIDANNIIALCSCLVFDEKSEDPITNNLDLMKAFETCKGIARNVAEVMVENKIPIDVEEYVQKLKPQLMEVVLHWLEGKRFHEIMNQCNLYEGSVVRVIRRLEELIRELATAAKTIGNEELASSMPGRYDHSAVEKDLYGWWESAGFFRPEVAEKVPSESEKKESYVVPMPPPNVTGRLHMGHAMFVSLEDVLTRFHRMRGDQTLWLPGTDHAGIATQMLVERQLAAEGTSRQEVGREEFLRRVWEWKEEKGGAIVDQMRCLGASADWSREQFTLNDHMSGAVVEAFCRLHEMGAIFRGQRMVNWSPVLQTAVSDLEVEYSDAQGHLYYFKYVVADSDGAEEEFIPVATTRPETILGDSAVCVHPEDPRYQHLIGRDVLVPVQGRRIPVIADAYVDREFGTGALKITPSHDFNDFEIGQRHGLENYTVIGLDGSMANTLEALGSPEYVGLDRAVCRKKLWTDLEEAGLALKVEDHMQRVPLSQRSGEVIEPMLSDQWFVSTEVMAQRALDAVESGDINIQPDRFVKTWQDWLKEKQPWCISRQLWWGHRIPVFYPTNRGSSDKYFVARSAEEALEAARKELGEDVELKQDEDVLDTWFSSGLWPFATVGWPSEDSEDYKKYYPATMMETGYDILFFWVARMVMMGLTLTDKAPFKEIYLHGLVRDEKGQKMSKTKGNVVDPLDSIAEYGTDALRYALLTSSVPGMDVPISKGMLENAKAFANKIWNVGRFIITEYEKNAGVVPISFQSGMTFTEEEIKAMPWLERALLSKCQGLCKNVTSALLENRFAPPTKDIKEFLQEDIAAWYVEASKTRLQEHLGGDPKSSEAATSQKVLLYLLEVSLKLLHPFMPFVTEAVWQRLPRDAPSPESLMICPWPRMSSATDVEAEGWFEKLCGLTSAVRNARAEQGIPPKERVALTFWCADASFQEALKAESSALAWLARADPDKIEARAMSERPSEMPSGCIRVVVSEEIEVDLPVPEKEIDVEKEPKKFSS
ncbi:unnamed protein product [Durusdinium trenchii]|uniref:valine--tRNA ligase n=1 Tax=Durusdinium trenchii TaxID=1381693 RepID=A0ABP0L761_9DINO